MKKDPCVICENFADGVECDETKCPVKAMKKENKRLKKRIDELELHVSYAQNPERMGQ